MNINIGTRFQSTELVVIKMTEGMDHSYELAMRMVSLLKKENNRRARVGEPLLGFKIETSGELLEQYPEVAQGKFRFVNDGKTYEEMDLGVVIGSNEFAGKNR